MPETVRLDNTKEYLYLRCTSCGERVKLAKNKGADWKVGYPSQWLSEFLLLHTGCDIALEMADD